MSHMRRLLPCFLALMICHSASVHCGEADEITKDVTQGALRIQQKDKVLECPLKHTDVRAEVTGFIARVRVTQTFYNPLDEKIEAVYVFPLPHGSAVDSMNMDIGARRIIGLIKRRDEAKQIYSAAIRAGKTAALLEQERPNIFTQTVGNIEPKQEVKIEITYVDVLKYDAGNYEFHFPMVVGPRYIPGNATSTIPTVPAELKGHVGEAKQVPPVNQAKAAEPKGTGWSADTTRVADASRITPPVLKPGERNGHDITLSLTLNAGVPIQDLKVPNHKADVKKQGDRQASIVLSKEDSIPNKDFVLRYAVQGEKPEMALLTDNDSSQGHFMLMIQPKVDETLKDAPPRELVFLIDVSGSMHGQPLAKCVEMLQQMLKLAKVGDTFQIITFANTTKKLFEAPMPVNDENIKKAVNFTNKLDSNGGTEMLTGVRAAIDDPLDPKRMRIVTMLTDGYIGNEAEIIEAISKGCGDKIRFWCVGIGNSVNQLLVDGVAKQSGGMGKILGLNEPAEPLAKELIHRMHRAQLAGVTLDWGGINVWETYPAKIHDLWIDSPIVIYGNYDSTNEQLKRTLTISGQVEGKPVTWTLAADFGIGGDTHSVLAKVWARQKIESLMHQTYYKGTPEVEEEVTQLALSYSLMSQYTSFVAVDEAEARQMKNSARPPRRMLVPVPIPEGTEYSGFFGDATRVSSNGQITTTALSALSQQTYYRYSTLPTSSQASDVVVPAELLAKAELGDHFETLNSDQLNLNSAFSGDDAKMFHAASDNDALGGGRLVGSMQYSPIGVGGASGSIGYGGGWGGGDGTGTGTGHGSFGSRQGGGRKLMVMRHGGSATTESGVDSSLKWLAAHQDADGHFEAKTCQATDMSNTVSTSLALLSWLGAGHSEKVGQYKDNVKRAVAWLIAHQNPDGSISDVSDTNNPKVIIPPQAVAAMALAEASGMARIQTTMDATQKTIDYCIKDHQENTNGTLGGWGFKAKSAGDLRATVWFVMALKSAKVSGLKVDHAAFEGALNFLSSVEHKDAANKVSVYWRSVKIEEPEQAHVLTAMGTLIRQFTGSKKEDLQASVEGFMAKGGAPSWQKIDPIYWYFGTLCTFQQGGDIWTKWNAELKKTLIDNQSKQGDSTGSWNAEWGAMHGSLCLQAYYRYVQLNPSK